MDNLDESGRYEFHGTAMTLTSHPTQDNMGEDPPPLDYNVPEGTSGELPVDFEFVTYLNECARDITLSPSGIGTIQPSFPDDYTNGVNDDAWLKHVHKVLAEKQGGYKIYQWHILCFSHIAREAIMLDQGPLWVFFLFVCFLRKSSINGKRLFHAPTRTTSSGCFMLLRTVHALWNLYGNPYKNRTEKEEETVTWWGKS